MPALCVADSLSERGATVEFVGARTGIEKDLVPTAGYPLHSFRSRASRAAPSPRQGRSAIPQGPRPVPAADPGLRPAAVLGVGGYASAPAVVAAGTLRVPTFLHEQNSVPGRVNRLASRFTTESFVTFPAAGPYLKDADWVGMPTRTELFTTSRDEALAMLNLKPPVVLIFGGSGGAPQAEPRSPTSIQRLGPLHGGPDLRPPRLPSPLRQQP